MYNRKYYESLARRVRILESIIIEGKRDQEVLNNFLGDEYYDKYNKVKGKIKDPEYKDIYKLIKKDLGDVKDYIDNVQSKSDVRRSDKRGAKKLYEDSDWTVYRITTYDAAKYYGKGTRWCITGNYEGHEERGEEYFYGYIRDYNLDGGYYFYINKSSGDKYCLLQDVTGRVQSIWDARDKSLGTKNTSEMMLPVVEGISIKGISPNEALLGGVQYRNITSIKRALSMGADINAVDRFGDTALMNAVLVDNVEIAKLLIDEGADINARSKSNGDTILMTAALTMRFEIAKLLIDSGADVNAKNKNGLTALIYAANSDYQLVKLLIDAGADVNAKSKHGYTPLKRAASKGQDDIVELLIKHGAKSESRKRNRLNRKYLY